MRNLNDKYTLSRAPAPALLMSAEQIMTIMKTISEFSADTSKHCDASTSMINVPSTVDIEKNANAI